MTIIKYAILLRHNCLFLSSLNGTYIEHMQNTLLLSAQTVANGTADAIVVLRLRRSTGHHHRWREEHIVVVVLHVVVVVIVDNRRRGWDCADSRPGAGTALHRFRWADVADEHDVRMESACIGHVAHAIRIARNVLAGNAVLRRRRGWHDWRRSGQRNGRDAGQQQQASLTESEIDKGDRHFDGCCGSGDGDRTLTGVAMDVTDMAVVAVVVRVRKCSGAEMSVLTGE